MVDKDQTKLVVRDFKPSWSLEVRANLMIWSEVRGVLVIRLFAVLAILHLRFREMRFRRKRFGR